MRARLRVIWKKAARLHSSYHCLCARMDGRRFSVLCVWPELGIDGMYCCPLRQGAMCLWLSRLAWLSWLSWLRHNRSFAVKRLGGRGRSAVCWPRDTWRPSQHWRGRAPEPATFSPQTRRALCVAAQPSAFSPLLCGNPQSHHACMCCRVVYVCVLPSSSPPPHTHTTQPRRLFCSSVCGRFRRRVSRP